MFRFTVCIAAAVAVSSQASLASEPFTVLEPRSSWNLDYADDSCRLMRIFGEGDDATAFYIERYGPGDGFAMVVAGKLVRKVAAREDRDDYDLQFGPYEKAREQAASLGDLGQYKPALIMTGVAFADDEKIKRPSYSQFDPADYAGATRPFEQKISIEREAQIEWLDIARDGRAPLRLALGPMGPPMAAMRKCTNDMAQAWGIDLAAHQQLTRPVVPTDNPGSWLNSNDYPRALLARGIQGLVQLRLSVGADGVPTQCHIQRSTRPQEFDDISCKRLLQRARFEPALDAQGKPIASFYRQAIRFQM